MQELVSTSMVFLVSLRVIWQVYFSEDMLRLLRLVETLGQRLLLFNQAHSPSQLPKELAQLPRQTLL
jgi:hypothetical protein